MDGVRLFHSIEEGRLFFKRAADGAGRDKLLIVTDGLLVGLGIEPHGCLAAIGEEFLADQAVLGRDFGGSPRCLPPGDGAGLKDDGLSPLHGEIKGSENSRETASDDGDFRVQTAWKMIPAGDMAGLIPNRFHDIHLVVRMCRFSESNHTCTQCPKCS